jgi:anaerobic selenocysteine-containing dehydrogenase
MNYLSSAAFNTSTLEYTSTGSDSAFNALLADVKAGAVDTIITLDSNVLYFSAEMAALADKVNLVSIADRADETASKAKVALPLSHYLEAWTDAIPVDGVYAVGQPTISPLFDSKSAVEIVNGLAGGSESAIDLIKASASTTGNAKAWNALLHDGFATTPVSVANGYMKCTISRFI